MNNYNYNVFIVDVYNLFYKSSFIENECLTKSGKETVHTEGIIGFFKAMNTYLSKFGTKDTKIYWLLDNAKTSVLRYRKDLSEDYKRTRKEQPSWFYRELDLLEYLLKIYRDNAELYRIKFLEADDFVFPVIKKNIKDTDRVLLISEDSDWCRALSDNVHQYKSKEIWTKEVFYDKMGFEATYSNICFYKTFYGDDADNIKGCIPTLPKVYFTEITKNYNQLSEFIKDALSNNISFFDLGWRKKIEKEEHNLLTNWNLVKAVDISQNELDSYKYVCEFKPQKLNIFYNSLGLIGKFDDRIKNNYKEIDLFAMLNGEDLERRK